MQWPERHLLTLEMAHNVSHSSIGANMRRSQDQVAEALAKRKEIVARYNETPWKAYGLDQLSVWVLWATIASSLFLFCTVSAVVLAVR